MTTEEIMRLALQMAGFARIPEDSAIHVPGRNIRRVLFGLDVDVAELALAKDLGFDLVIAHHPNGVTPDQWKLFLRHVEFMTAAGVPEDVALSAVAEKVEALQLRGQSANYDHVPSVARLLKMPFMNIHAPLDELGRRRIREEVDRVVLARPNATVGDLVAALAALPEMVVARSSVQVVLGDEHQPVRKVVVGHGALTNGGYPVAKACYAHGVDTVIYIHIDFGELQRLRADGHGNLIIIGHLAGDSLGISPFHAELARRGLEVVAFSGVIPPWTA